MADLDTLPDRMAAIRREIRDEYLKPHAKPWVVGFSAGKDSTLVLHLVVEMLLAISPAQRKRPVYVLSNDTLVESPVFQAWVEKSLRGVREGATALRLPVHVVQTHPEGGETFWVNMLGRGYPAPNPTFRWCTDRMKIRPTTRFIYDRVAESGEVILLLGVRRAESAARAARIGQYDQTSEDGRLNPHNRIEGCYIFRPIVDLADDEVWLILLNSRPPWGGKYRELFLLYRNAKGGDCPFVVSDDDVPSCGSNSARFGCWTCTVVEKDSSLDALIDAGFENLEELSQFRERLKEVSRSPDCRSKTRRNGRPGLGPLTIEARKLLLHELLDIQSRTGLSLINEQEIRMIEDHWNRDESDQLLRDIDNLVQLSLGGIPA